MKDIQITKNHITRKKDSFFSISREYGITINELYEANPEIKGRKEGAKVGEILKIPLNKKAILPKIQ